MQRSISASDIDQKNPLNRVLSAEFEDQFYVKVDFPLHALVGQVSITPLSHMKLIFNYLIVYHFYVVAHTHPEAATSPLLLPTPSFLVWAS